MKKSHNELLVLANKFVDEGHIRKYCREVCGGYCCGNHFESKKYPCNMMLACTTFICGRLFAHLFKKKNGRYFRLMMLDYRDDARRVYHAIYDKLYRVYKTSVLPMNNPYFGNFDMKHINKMNFNISGKWIGFMQSEGFESLKKKMDYLIRTKQKFFWETQ